MTPESNSDTRRFRLAACVLVALGAMLAGADALAIDGNYSSPYASQYDNRSTVAMLSGEALAGMAWLGANLLLAGFFALRARSRRCRAGLPTAG